MKGRRYTAGCPIRRRSIAHIMRGRFVPTGDEVGPPEVVGHQGVTVVRRRGLQMVAAPPRGFHIEQLGYQDRAEARASWARARRRRKEQRAARRRNRRA